MRRITVMLAAIIGLLMPLMVAVPANAAICENKVSKQSHNKTVDVANSLQSTAGYQHLRRIHVTAFVEYSRCVDPGGNHVFDNVQAVSIKYTAQKNDKYLGSSYTGGWTRNKLNCSDGVSDDDWFKKVEVIWFNQGLGGWNPPSYTIECQSDGQKREWRYPAGGTVRVNAGNTTKWRADTTVVREGLRWNYNHTHTGEVK